MLHGLLQVIEMYILSRTSSGYVYYPVIFAVCILTKIRNIVNVFFVCLVFLPTWLLVLCVFYSLWGIKENLKPRDVITFLSQKEAVTASRRLLQRVCGVPPEVTSVQQQERILRQHESLLYNPELEIIMLTSLIFMLRL